MKPKEVGMTPIQLHMIFPATTIYNYAQTQVGKKIVAKEFGMTTSQ